ncbi:MAG: sulfatase [Verrucomicrobiales bacterium]|nr:sulfatase [Verrucomicrobiales bacterium]
MPAAFQGTTFSSTKPIRFLERPKGITSEKDNAARSALRVLESEAQSTFPGDANLAARIASYELAARMQLTVPEAASLKAEPAHIHKLYGADSDDRNQAAFAENCILARRLVERGVRFVQLFNGAYASGGRINWDGHFKLKEQYDVHGRILDQPVAGLLRDLKQRGLLEDTLVVFATEFGRMPMFQAGTYGRDHNPHGFTAWLAGAGVKGGISYGATDEFGFSAADKVITPHDFHATILHLLGLDHEKLTFYHNGIQRRLTDVHGQVIRDILA